MRGYFRPSRESDVDLIAPNLRKEDMEEIRIAGTETADYYLRQGLKESEVCNTIVLNDVPSAMFGISRTEWGGVPWLLSTSDFRCVRYSFLKKSKKWVDEMTPSYGLLKNMVHDQNETAIGWLKFLGFTLTTKIPIEKDNKLYYFWEFERRDT